MSRKTINRKPTLASVQGIPDDEYEYEIIPGPTRSTRQTSSNGSSRLSSIINNASSSSMLGYNANPFPPPAVVDSTRKRKRSVPVPMEISSSGDEDKAVSAMGPAVTPVLGGTTNVGNGQDSMEKKRKLNAELKGLELEVNTHRSRYNSYFCIKIISMTYQTCTLCFFAFAYLDQTNPILLDKLC